MLQQACEVMRRYYRDVTFHYLVDVLANTCHKAEYSIEYLRDAAALAEVILLRERLRDAQADCDGARKARPDLVTAFGQIRPVYDPAWPAGPERQTPPEQPRAAMPDDVL